MRGILAELKVIANAVLSAVEYGERAVEALERRNVLLAENNVQVRRYNRRARKEAKERGERLIEIQRKAAAELAKTSSEAVEASVHEGQLIVLDEALERIAKANTVVGADAFVRSIRDRVAESIIYQHFTSNKRTAALDA